jgi:hypothetical protein
MELGPGLPKEDSRTGVTGIEAVLFSESGIIIITPGTESPVCELLLNLTLGLSATPRVEVAAFSDCALPLLHNSV